jgi:hypothetical protein
MPTDSVVSFASSNMLRVLLFSLLTSFVLSLESPSPTWLSEHPESEIHFRKKGQVIGSLNWVHLRLDLSLTHITDSITAICNASLSLLGVNRTFRYQDSRYGHVINSSFNSHVRLYDDMAFESITALHSLDKDRCYLLQQDWYNLLTVWLREDPHSAASPSRPQPPRSPSTRRPPPVIEQMRLEPHPPETPPTPSPPRVTSRAAWIRFFRNRINRLPEGPSKSLEMKRLEKYIQHLTTLTDDAYAGTWGNRDPTDPRSSWADTSTSIAHDDLDDIFDPLSITPPPTTETWGRKKRSNNPFHPPMNSLLLRARTKRQVILLGFLLGLGIMALASTLFSHLQLASVSIQSGTNQLAVKIMQEHETRLTVNERSIGLLKDNLETMNGAILGVYYTVLIMKHTLVNDEVEKEIRRLMTAIQLLSQHRLDPTLIENNLLGGIHNDAVLIAESKGLSLASRTPEDIFRFETSHLIFKNMTLRIFVHLPAYRTNALLDLVEFVSVPLNIGEATRFMMPLPEGEILAISRGLNMFRTMKKSSLAECSRVAELYYCKQDNLFDKRFQSSCLVALYNADHAAITKNCRFQVQPANDFLVQLNGTTFLLYQPEKSYLEQSCGEVKSKASFQGIRKINVPPGCSVSTQSFVFDGAQGLFGDPTDIEQKIFSAPEVMSEALLYKLGNISEQEYARLAEVGSVAGLKIRDIIAEFKAQETTSIITIGLGTCLLIVFTCLICLCCLRARHFKKRMAQEGRVFFFNSSGGKATAQMAGEEAEMQERQQTRSDTYQQSPHVA